MLNSLLNTVSNGVSNSIIAAKDAAKGAKDALFSGLTFNVELNGEEYEKEFSILGSIIRNHYFKTYASTTNNAMIVVNKALWYAIRIVHVDQDKNQIVMTKVCDRATLAEVNEVANTVIKRLQCIAGYFFIDKKMTYPDIKCGGMIKYKTETHWETIETPRRPSEFILSSFKWYIAPLRDYLALPNKNVASHSKIVVKFIHKKDKTLIISLMVERTQQGIYHQVNPYISLQNNGTWGAASHGQFCNVNLKEFLIECNRHHQYKYKLNEYDCHCFAQSLWRYCVYSYIQVPDKPDIKWTTVLSLLGIRRSPEKEEYVEYDKQISYVHPDYNDEKEILGNLGIAKDDLVETEIKLVEKTVIEYTDYNPLKNDQDDNDNNDDLLVYNQYDNTPPPIHAYNGIYDNDY